MSIIQLLKALAFGVRMLCNLAELAVTIWITRALKLCLCLSGYLLHRGGRSKQALIKANPPVQQCKVPCD